MQDGQDCLNTELPTLSKRNVVDHRVDHLRDERCETFHSLRCSDGPNQDACTAHFRPHIIGWMHLSRASRKERPRSASGASSTPRRGCCGRRAATSLRLPGPFEPLERDLGLAIAAVRALYESAFKDACVMDWTSVAAHLARMLAFDIEPGVKEWRRAGAARRWYWTRRQQADLLGELPGPFEPIEPWVVRTGRSIGSVPVPAVVIITHPAWHLHAALRGRLGSDTCVV